MENIELEDYYSLKDFMKYDKESINKHKQKGTFWIKQEQEKRLIELGYIDFDENSNFLYNPKYFATKKGYQEFCRLRRIHQNQG